MYAPPFAHETDPDILHDAVRQIQFAALVSGSDSAHAVTHVPMVLKRRDGIFVLQSHVARPNGHWQAVLAEPAGAVAIFQGPQAYISPSWYASKKQHGKVVPTWTYIAVHAHGSLQAIDDAAWLREHLGDLTDANEQGREQPWGIGDAPESYIGKMTRAIVGLELKIERLEGSWKLNQNKNDADRSGVIAGLGAEAQPSSRAISEIMSGLEAKPIE